MSSKFAVGDRVEYAPTIEDLSYVGDAEQYRGQQGTVVEAYSDEEDAFFATFFGDVPSTIGVNWDDESMREAAAGYDESNRSAFEENVQKIEEAN